MAKTIENKPQTKDLGPLLGIPVASGETIYQGTLAAVGPDGYLYNLDSAAIPTASAAVFVADQTGSEDRVPTATTANGSISSGQRASEIAGDKTVRLCHTQGKVRMTATSIGQDDLFQTMYATDNFTMDESQLAGIPIGSLVTYESATAGWVDLNVYYKQDGTITYKAALIAATTTTGGDVISWANPSGGIIMVTDVLIDITTPATGTPTLDVGVAANGTTSSDTIYDAVAVGVAAGQINATTGDGGTNGKLVRKVTSAQYITATPSASAVGMVGTYEVTYKNWK